MAQYYFRNTGSTSWNTATNWSLTDGGGATWAVPTSSDDAFFSNSSWNCVVDVAIRDCKSLDFTKGTGYAGTFTVSNLIRVSGDLKLNWAMTYAGSSTLMIPSGVWSVAFVSNGITISWALTLWSNTYTFLWNAIVTWLVSWTWGATSTLNRTTNESLTCNGWLTISGSSYTWSLKIRLGGGTLTCSTTSTALRNNTDIVWNIAFWALVTYSSWTLTWVSGTVDTTTNSSVFYSNGATYNVWANIAFNEFRFAWTNTLNADIYTTTLSCALTGTFAWTGKVTTAWTAWTVNNFTFIPSSNTIFTLTADITVNNTFTLTMGSTISSMFGYSMTLKWDINTSWTLNLRNNTTTTFTYAGTGTRTGTAPTQISFCWWWLQNLTINTAGTLTLWANAVFGWGTLTYTAWTVVTTGSTLWISDNSTLNTNGITWNNIAFNWTTLTPITPTLSSLLTATGTIYFFYQKYIFAWASVFTCNNLVLVSSANATTECSLKSWLTYTVSTWIRTISDANYRPTLSATTPSSPAYLVFNGSSQNITYIDLIDIDSSWGNILFYWWGSKLRTVNWYPTAMPLQPYTTGKIFIWQ